MSAIPTLVSAVSSIDIQTIIATSQAKLSALTYEDIAGGFFAISLFPVP
jgi:hypothetical protein